MKITLDTDNPQHHAALEAILHSKGIPDDFDPWELSRALQARQYEHLGQFYAQSVPGDLCRTAEGAPARYIGQHYCLFVSAMDNDLCWSLARPPKGNEHDFPLPSDFETKIAASLVHLLPDSPTIFYKQLQTNDL